MPVKANPGRAPAPHALILGGTGMLAGCARQLHSEGWQLTLPSRRGYDVPPGTGTGLRADWDEPLDLATRVAARLSAPANLLVAWVHTPYRVPVLRALEGLLAARPDGSAVVEVYGSAASDPSATLPEPVLPRPTHQVVLGFHRYRGQSRWLTDAEISQGVHRAVTAAVRGDPAGVHEVGRLRPWVERP